jgi:hypothetical protein
MEPTSARSHCRGIECEQNGFGATLTRAFEKPPEGVLEVVLRVCLREFDIEEFEDVPQVFQGVSITNKSYLNYFIITIERT